MTVPPTPRSRSRWFIYAAVALVLGGAVWYFGFGSSPQQKRWVQPAWAGTGHPPKVPVRAVEVKLQPLPVHIRAIGTVTALNTVTVQSRVGGQLLSVLFEEGQKVSAGQVLAEIDPEPLRIQVNQAEGQLTQNVARLNSARSDLERVRELHGRNLVTNQDLDLQQALVAEREGTVAASRAQVEEARLRLGYTRVTAPISGRVGLRRVDAGNLIREGDTNGLAVLTQTSPISVAFTIPEVELASVLPPFRAGEVLTVEAWDRSEKNLLATGVLKTLDNRIDTATGTLRLKAEFANEDEMLFPNQFVNIRLRVKTLPEAVVIPASAVQFGARGTYVYVINAENKALVRDVVLGPVEGEAQAITQGLSAGEKVVLEGLDRLREGSVVVMVNEVTPPAKP